MSDRSRIDALEARLVRAWRGNDGPALDARWKAGVMNSVRAEAARARAAAGPPVERLVRNAFLAAAAAAVLVVVVVIGGGARAGALDPSRELARLLASDPQGLLQLVLVF